ncbi:hypothetical protein N0V83_006814 [Neocucurbitaria cava]|uniref:Uncharacterized protein n=1 Tax=Neocucurbitaria cava TaxID=798079 RepID=A0A9W8Y6U6_9PLEO|nr:hypothetical protein N0V83_006814 [Neocucurbitaria cava]
MLAVLDILMVKDNDTTCDFLRGQSFVRLLELEDVRPDSFPSLAIAESLKGMRISVPRVFIGEDDPAAVPNRSVQLSKKFDIPAVTNYDLPPWDAQVETDWPIPHYYNYSGGPNWTFVAAYAWDDFLAMVDDENSIISLAYVNPSLVFPQLPGALPDRYSNQLSNRTGSYDRYVEIAQKRNAEDIFGLPNVGAWLQSLEYRHIADLENWMDDKSLDLVVWPSAGDVGPQDIETNETAAEIGWRNGVARSNGNAAIHQLGIPTVSVSMGAMSDIHMPVDLAFAGKAYDDKALLSCGYAFETAHEKRFAPPQTPELEITSECAGKSAFTRGSEAPLLTAEAMRNGDSSSIIVSGSISSSDSSQVEVFLDVEHVGPVQFNGSEWSVTAAVTAPWFGSDFPEKNVPPQWLAMVVVVASARNGRSNGKLMFS